MKSGTVVLATARTPFGRLGGALSSLVATTLGGDAIRNAIARAGIDPANVEHVIMGEVVQAGVGQAPARQAAFKAGLAKTTTAETVNKVCASGMLAATYAARYIAGGDYRVVVAGGMESMSNAPYLLPGARNGYRYGNGDPGRRDDPRRAVGLLLRRSDGRARRARRRRAGRHARGAGRVRVPEPQARARSARSRAVRRAEIAPINVATKAKGKIVVDAMPVAARARIPAFAGACGGSVWEHVPPAEHGRRSGRSTRPTSPATSPLDPGRSRRAGADRRLVEAMAKLKPIDAGGTITAGNAPGVNDGAAALVLSSAEYARSQGVEAAGRARRSCRRGVGSAVLGAGSGDGGTEIARSARAQGERHPRVGDQRGVRGGRADGRGAARARSRR